MGRDTNETTGDRIIAARSRKRLSQQDLCDLTGITQPTMSAIENGRQPTTSQAIAIADALELSLDALLGRR